MGTGALLTYVRNNRVIGDYYGISSYNYFFDTYGQDASGFIGELSAKGVSFIAAKRDMLSLRKWAGWGDYMRSSLVIEYEDDPHGVVRPSLMGNGCKALENHRQLQ